MIAAVASEWRSRQKTLELGGDPEQIAAVELGREIAPSPLDAAYTAVYLLELVETFGTHALPFLVCLGAVHEA